MKIGFYPKLALAGIRKNRRLYTPFLLTCAGMAAMYYIICFLASTSLLEALPGHGTIQAMLSFGSGVLAIFAAIFLFYTNSFLIRRRKKEFGLYNILGMGKGNIGRILFWETVVTALFALAAGLGVGVALSKLAELGLTNIMGGQAQYAFSVSFSAVLQTTVLFCCIFLLLLLNGLRQIHVTNPIALLRSENIGEKPPKANWLIGVAGAVILAAAYAISLTIKDPVAATLVFFVAVAMVVIATYMLFVSGSVLLCRLLQRNKRYYYRANHFVSVSSMAYRMKRNGAGLASICILLTMVLVMVSSSACLYFGAEDSLRTRYPREITVDIKFEESEAFLGDGVPSIRSGIQRIAAAHGIRQDNLYDYRYITLTGLLHGETLEPDVRGASGMMQGELHQFYIVPLADYNRMMGTDLRLDADEALLYSLRNDYSGNTLTIQNGPTFRIREKLLQFTSNGNALMDILPSIFLVVSDMEASLKALGSLTDFNGGRIMGLYWSYGFDTNVSDEAQTAACKEIREWLGKYGGEGFLRAASCESRAANREDFYGTFGGIFFLGILLSIVFLFATVLIIYYKQISEGYEDQGRFAIMQKVGMTKPDIRRSIHSQMLTVFLLPLVTAVVHLAFAFPIIRKLLLLFNMTNIELFLLTTLITILISAVFYALVYRSTSNAYYAIVSDAKEAQG